MDPIDYLRFLAALAFVLGLIALAAWAARRFRLGNAAPGAARRLAVIETLRIDPRRKLVLARCDDHDYLLLLGQDGNRLLGRRPGTVAAPPPTPRGELR
jgi:flagellar protein FliO/FliZ